MTSRNDLFILLMITTKFAPTEPVAPPIGDYCNYFFSSILLTPSLIACAPNVVSSISFGSDGSKLRYLHYYHPLFLSLNLIHS